MLESIKILRNYTQTAEKYDSRARHDLLVLADKIETEIAERYMLLPVDARNVPIHINDTLIGDYATFKVCAISETDVYHDNGRHWDRADTCCHVKPRTVEDVLLEFVDHYNFVKGGCDEPSVIKKYVAELNDLLGGDTEC